MATQYDELIRNVLLRLERADGKARLAAEQSVNEAILVAALLFDVPELVTTANANASGNSSSFSLANSANLIFDVLKIRNTVANNDMGYIPLDLLDIVVPSSANYPKYWSRAGGVIQFRGIAAANQTFVLTVKVFPSALANSNDAIPYDGHDPEVLALATTLAAATLKETEKFNFWKGVLESLQIPYSKVEAAQSRIEGVRSGTNKPVFANQTGTQTP